MPLKRFAQDAVRIQADWLIDNLIIAKNNTIAISSIEKVAKIIEIFGAHIRILKINFNKIGRNRAKRITEAINENDLNSLERLEITDCPERHFPEHFWRREKQFISVKSMFFKNKLNTIKRMRLHHIFPSVRHLTLANVECDHPNCFNYEFLLLLQELHSAHSFRQC